MSSWLRYAKPQIGNEMFFLPAVEFDDFESDFTVQFGVIAVNRHY